MPGLKQKSVQCYANIPDSGYIRPPSTGSLPFRSRQSVVQNEVSPYEHRVQWQNRDGSTQELRTDENSPANESANVKSWLISGSPTSVIKHAQEKREPSTPSPICSPSPSTPDHSPEPHFASLNSEAPSSELEPARIVTIGEDLPSGSRRIKKKAARQNPEMLLGSPTGSTGSSVSEGGLLALLANKLFSNKEQSRPSSRYSREKSGPVDDKHVVEDRGCKPSVEEFVPNVNPLHREPSEATSEMSIGSATGRTLSMEFDAILAAAVAAGVTTALSSENQPTLPAEDTVQTANLPASRENSSQQSPERQEIGTAAAAAMPFALAAEQRDGDVNAGTANVTEMSPTLRSLSQGSRRVSSERVDNSSVVLPSSSNNSSHRSSSNDCDRNSLAGASEDDRSYGKDSLVSPSSSEGSSKENISPNSGKQALEKVRRDRILAQVVAYKDAKNSMYNNRYKREEAKINAWENQQRIKATMSMKKVEMKLEEKRAKALEKMQNDIAAAHKRAEERKASAEAVRGSKAAKVAVLTDNMRQMGKVSTGCFPF